MSDRKDKRKVVGEPMTDEQILVFFERLPEEDENPDFHLLLRAYRGLRAHDFVRFVTFFKERGHNLDATDPKGRSMAQIIATHRHGEPYLDALKQAGASL
jgi:hypothetical protein